jgi:hypothetical protein
MGWLGRCYGLSCNNVGAIEVVTADGRLLRVDAGTEPDLFWALRGGGAASAWSPISSCGSSRSARSMPASCGGRSSVAPPGFPCQPTALRPEAADSDHDRAADVRIRRKAIASPVSSSQQSKISSTWSELAAVACSGLAWPFLSRPSCTAADLAAYAMRLAGDRLHAGVHADLRAVTALVDRHPAHLRPTRIDTNVSRRAAT